MQLALARDAALDLLDRAAAARPRWPRRLWLAVPVLALVAALAAWWWRPTAGALQRVGPPTARAGLAVAPDGRRLAYLASGARGATGGAERLDELWVAVVGAPRGERLWRLPAPEQHLVDLAWAPDGAHLLA